MIAPPSLARRVVAEGLGTALLLAVIVGSGITAERLSGGNVALALLANALATGAGLVALILTFGPLSGAHFNPVVTCTIAAAGGLRWRETPAYVLAQVIGGIAGVLVTHGMFGSPLITWSQHERSGSGQWLSECVATAGLLAVIQSCGRHRPTAAPYAVAGYVTAAYWFTASTAFANPAVTIARCCSDTFSGIRPIDVPAFIVAQVVGALLVGVLFRWLLRAPTPAPAQPLSEDPHA
jgi:glycerol uptake facilitator-like aquaporin